MKKLTKLDLHSVQIMDDAQMKQILGGGDGGDEYPEGYDPDPAVRACKSIGGTPGDMMGKDCGYVENGTFRTGVCEYWPDGGDWPVICRGY